MSKNAHRLAVALLLALMLRQVPAAQNDAGAIVTVPANSEARSAAFALTATGELTVTLQSTAPTGGTVRLYVFDQAGVLRGLDDPEVTEPVFTLVPGHDRSLLRQSREHLAVPGDAADRIQSQ